MVCLDTSFIVDVLRGNEDAKKRLDELTENSETVTIAAPTLMELQANIELNQRGTREQKIIDKIKSAAILLPLDPISATVAGKIEAKLILAAETISPVDIMIAAIALHHDEALLTRNTKHFSRIPRLQVEGY